MTLNVNCTKYTINNNKYTNSEYDTICKYTSKQQQIKKLIMQQHMHTPHQLLGYTLECRQSIFQIHIVD